MKRALKVTGVAVVSFALLFGSYAAGFNIGFQAGAQAMFLQMLFGVQGPDT